MALPELVESVKKIQAKMDDVDKCMEVMDEELEKLEGELSTLDIVGDDEQEEEL